MAAPNLTDIYGNRNPNDPVASTISPSTTAYQTATTPPVSDTTAAIDANPLAYQNTQIAAQDTAIQDQYTSAAMQLTQQGDLTEQGLFGNAADIAHSNALLSITAGDIQQAQDQRTLLKTQGSQQAGYAAGGFAQAGTALNVFRSSTQQGELEQQLDVTNAQAKAGGFYAQEAAARAQGSAAGAAAGVAGVTGEGAGVLAAANQTRAVNEATQIAQAAQDKMTAQQEAAAATNPLGIQPTTYDPITGKATTPSNQTNTQFNTTTGQPYQTPKVNAFDPVTGQPNPTAANQTIYNTNTGAPTQVPGTTIPAALPTTASILAGNAVLPGAG